MLIVEDDADIVTTVKEALEAAGYEVGTAKDGLEGLDALHGLKNEPRPDLILLDLMMPVISGWEFLHAKQSDDSVKNIPVVVITAATCHEARGRFGVDGAILLIHKPFGLETLLCVVGRALRPRPTNRPPPM